MDKTAIKKYAAWARQDLMNRVKQKAYQYGITENEAIDKDADNVNGKLLSATEKTQRKALLRKISQNGFDHVIEEVAYTWFNRFCALRFMEVNGYLPLHVRVFTDEHNKFKPQILSEAMSISLPGLNIDKVYELKEHNQIEELYKYLLIAQCNALSDILPGMFQRIEDHTELLFPDNLLREGSVIARLISDIPADNFDVRSDNGQIEIVGWLYQYYITEKHEEVVDPLHGKRINKDDVPAATQLFTTDWIVRYLIDNTLGRYWIERNPQSKLRNELQYFVAPKSGEIKYKDEKIEPKELTVLDPCVGSGHFLVYAFDVLVKIYIEYGYSARDAARIIMEFNLFGLDIDVRATQLAYFSLMMKARQYDSRFFERGIQPKIYSIEESNHLDKATFDYIVGNDQSLKNDLQQIVDTFRDAKEYGCILQMPSIDFESLKRRFDEIIDDISLYRHEALNSYLPIVQAAEVLANKYAVVATNPPYMNKYDEKLKGFVESNYKAYGGDLFSVFVYRNLLFCKDNGYSGYMTPNVWMFIKTYEKLRNHILTDKHITTLIQLAKGAFFKEATVDICAFVLCNEKRDENGLYIRLEDFKGDMDVQREKVLEALQDDSCKYLFDTKQSNFAKIPGSPIAYWVSQNAINNFVEFNHLRDFGCGRIGLITGDTGRFIRLWHEVPILNIGYGIANNDESISSKKRWFPLQNGGAYRKWYGNNDSIVDWENDGYRMKFDNFVGTRVKSHNYNGDYAFKRAISWTTISSSSFACRYADNGFIFDTAGPFFVPDNQENLYSILAFLQSKTSEFYLKLLNPTINFPPGYIESLPYCPKCNNSETSKSSGAAILISKSDWDSYETSWDFKKHPLI